MITSLGSEQFNPKTAHCNHWVLLRGDTGFLLTGWRITGTNRRRSLDSTREEYTHRLAPKARWTEISSSGCRVSYNCLPICAPVQADQCFKPTHSVSQCSSGYGAVKTGKKHLTVRQRGDPVPRPIYFLTLCILATLYWFLRLPVNKMFLRFEDLPCSINLIIQF